MNRSKTLLMSGAIAAGIIGMVTIASLGQGLNAEDSVANVGCLPLDNITPLVPIVQLPAYLPEGYEYKCGIVEFGEANLLFWNQTLDRSTYEVDPINAAWDTPGSILIRVSERPSITDPSNQAEQEYRYIAENNPKLGVQLIEIAGNPAWANDISANAGTQEAKFPDGEVITKTYDMPARIRIFESGKMIHIEGFVPLSELKKVAESLQ